MKNTIKTKHRALVMKVFLKSAVLFLDKMNRQIKEHVEPFFLKKQ